MKEVDIQMNFENLKINEKIINGLKAMGIN